MSSLLSAGAERSVKVASSVAACPVTNLVTPAQAGVQRRPVHPRGAGLDPRLRGDDGMAPRRARVAGLLLAAALFAAPPAHAHEGEDHGAAAAATAPATPAAPRFAAASDAYELVGVLSGRQLTLWLDRAATNAPVTAGTLELELGDVKLQARPAGDTWVATLPAAPAPGTLPVTATVTAEGGSDLLAGELVLAAPGDGHEAPSGRRLGLWAAAAALAAAIAYAAGRLLPRRRTP